MVKRGLIAGRPELDLVWRQSAAAGESLVR
jgi:hypothetical protein